MLELKACVYEFGGSDAGAGEDEFLTHFAQHSSNDKGRDRTKSWTVQDLAEGLGEFAVSDRIGSDKIDGARECLLSEAEPDGIDNITKGDPTEILFAAAYGAAKSHVER